MTARMTMTEQMGKRAERGVRGVTEGSERSNREQD
jgi:hypothetical protein